MPDPAIIVGDGDEIHPCLYHLPDPFTANVIIQGRQAIERIAGFVRKVHLHHLVVSFRFQDLDNKRTHAFINERLRLMKDGRVFQVDRHGNINFHG